MIPLDQANDIGSYPAPTSIFAQCENFASTKPMVAVEAALASTGNSRSVFAGSRMKMHRRVDFEILDYHQLR